VNGLNCLSAIYSNLITIQLFIILSYKDLTAACSWKPQLLVRSILLGWRNYEMEITKVVCTWPTTGHCQMCIW